MLFQSIHDPKNDTNHVNQQFVFPGFLIQRGRMMHKQYDGPEFMKPHFYPCPHKLKALLPEHHVHQGIQCLCSHKQLSLFRRAEHPVVFALCQSCDHEFQVYANEDYPAGYISDDPTKPLESITCNCGGQVFQVAVGYEYPGDEMDSTDITWFTMVGKCSTCGGVQELFNDETG
jgi:hypothetical protein